MHLQHLKINLLLPVFSLAGQSLTFLETDGPGVTSRIWIPIVDRSPEMLSGMAILMFWSGMHTPVSGLPDLQQQEIGTANLKLIDHDE